MLVIYILCIYILAQLTASMIHVVGWDFFCLSFFIDFVFTYTFQDGHIFSFAGIAPTFENKITS